METIVQLRKIMQNLTLISPPTSYKAHSHLFLKLTETTLKRMAQMYTTPTGSDQVSTCLGRSWYLLGEARYAHMKRHIKDRDRGATQNTE